MLTLEGGLKGGVDVGGNALLLGLEDDVVVGDALDGVDLGCFPH